jgi:uncharacterized membrane protein
VTPVPRTRGRILAPLASTLNLLGQLALVVLGVVVGAVPDAEETLELLDWWCFLALIYLVGAAIGVAFIARSPSRSGERRPPSRLHLSRAAGFVASTCTVLASLCGIAGAVQVRFGYVDAADRVQATVVGTAAMLLAWVLLHWGYAQTYHRRHSRSPRPLLGFPGTERPRLSDFAYFAFTVGTTFAASDVKVLSPRLRWTVAKHSVLSFFYNGAIIVLALNTLTAST